MWYEHMGIVASHGMQYINDDNIHTSMGGCNMWTVLPKRVA